jgi:hypothetical protein
MAKDQTRNIDTFKISANRVNDSDFHQRQAEIPGQFARHKRDDSKPPTAAERIAELTERAHQKLQKRKKKGR